ELPLGFAGGVVTSPERQIWEQVCLLLKNRIGAAMVERWFSRTGIHDLDTVRLVVRVPNLMNQYWIEDHFMAVLLEAVAEAVGGAREIAFQVTADPNETLPLLREAALRQDHSVAKETDLDTI